MEEIYNFINKRGECNSIWMTQVAAEREGLSMVQREDRKVNFVNREGKCVSDKWFKSASPFIEGFARVQREEDKEWNFLKPDGTLLSDEWYYASASFTEGIAKVQRSNGKWYFINNRGVDICDQGFKIADNFKDGFAKVYTGEDEEMYKLDKEGVLHPYQGISR